MFTLWLAALALSSLAVPTSTSPETSVGASVEEIPWKKGDPGIQSISSLAFGEDGVLFLGDPQGGAIFALQTGDRDGKASAQPYLNVGNIDATLAAMLGTTSDDLRILDLAVNPNSGAAYLALSRQGEGGATPVLVRVVGPESDETKVIELTKLPYLKAALENSPPKDEGGRRSRRTQTVTDLAFHEGVLYVAGLSNEEFASKLRALPFPFQDAGQGTSIEIYHAAHGAWETRAPVRTMLPIDLAGNPYLLCGYTCTPLVKVPMEALAKSEKFVGTTVAELGNRNTPLDMIVYEKDGSRFVLVANTSRGVMKIAAELLIEAGGLTEPVQGTAGVGYETIESLADVRQLAPIDSQRGLVLLDLEDGLHLEVIELP